jgi:O-antigen ligase
MSTTIAAFLASLITTGATSAVSHEFTVVGGSCVTVIFALTNLFQQRVNLYPAFLFGAVAMIIIALISAEANNSPFSSTIHVLSMYTALIALAFSSPNCSQFCRRFMLTTNLMVTASVLYQSWGGEFLKAWQISNPAGGPNIMAAQINMTLPLILFQATSGSGMKKVSYSIVAFLNCLSIVLIMSRSGIGTMLIIFTLYALFNHKRMAIFVCSSIMGIGLSLDNIIQMPSVRYVLMKMRFIEYNATAPRSLIWRLAWNQISANPIVGVGPGGTKRVLSLIDTYHAHNNFVQVALETGILTCAIITLMAFLLLLLPAKAAFGSQKTFVFTLPILAYLSYSWTDMPLSFPGTTLLLAASVNEARLATHKKISHSALPEFHGRAPGMKGISRAA